MANINGKVFEIYPKIKCEKVHFKNRFGIELCGDLYLPEGYEDKQNAAIIVSGPFGAVKEQSSGLYAQEFANMGFVSIAFDPSFTGESGGEVRNVASPEIFTEDFSAAVDFVGLLPYVNRERIGAMAICGLSGMAITAATSDTRIKAVAPASMYDMCRSISKGYKDSYTAEDRQKIKEFLSRQRWIDAENGSFDVGAHELGFDENGNVVKVSKLFPDTLPEDIDPVSKAFFDYYCTERGYHKNAINSAAAWTQTTPFSFFNFSLMENIKEISPRPIMLIAGENAHSRYYSEDVYAAANEPKELVIVPGADHVDLYDRMDKIPFNKLRKFFEDALK